MEIGCVICDCIFSCVCVSKVYLAGNIYSQVCVYLNLNHNCTKNSYGRSDNLCSHRHRSHCQNHTAYLQDDAHHPSPSSVVIISKSLLLQRYHWMTLKPLSQIRDWTGTKDSFFLWHAVLQKGKHRHNLYHIKTYCSALPVFYSFKYTTASCSLLYSFLCEKL